MLGHNTSNWFVYSYIPQFILINLYITSTLKMAPSIRIRHTPATPLTPGYPTHPLATPLTPWLPHSPPGYPTHPLATPLTPGYPTHPRVEDASKHISKLALSNSLFEGHLMREDGATQDLALRLPHLRIVITCTEEERKGEGREEGERREGVGRRRVGRKIGRGEMKGIRLLAV